MSQWLIIILFVFLAHFPAIERARSSPVNKDAFEDSSSKSGDHFHLNERNYHEINDSVRESAGQQEVTDSPFKRLTGADGNDPHFHPPKNTSNSSKKRTTEQTQPAEPKFVSATDTPEKDMKKQIGAKGSDEQVFTKTTTPSNERTTQPAPKQSTQQDNIQHQTGVNVPTTEGPLANDDTTEKQMSLSSSRANTDGRITVTTPMTDINTEISPVRTAEILTTLVVLAVALVIVSVLLFYYREKVVALYERYTSRRQSNDTANEEEFVPAKYSAGQDQDKPEERNFNEETRSPEGQPLIADANVSPHVDADDGVRFPSCE